MDSLSGMLFHLTETQGIAGGWRGAVGLSLPVSGAGASPTGVWHEPLAGSLACMPGFLTGAWFIYLLTRTVYCPQLYLPAPDPMCSPAAQGD